MAGPRKDFCITQNSRFEFRIVLTRNSLPLNLTDEDFTPRMQLRESNGTLFGEFTAVTVGSSDHIAALSLAATLTATLAVGTMYQGRLMLQHNNDPTLDLVTPTRYFFQVEASDTLRV